MGSLDVDRIQNMTAMELFQTQLSSSSAEAHTDALKRLSVVAVSLGKEKARKELIPFLLDLGMGNSSPQAQSDEVLLILGQEIIPVAQWICTESLPEWLPLLERLATAEETVVRDQAVVCFQEFASLDPKMNVQPWVAICKRLAGADWFTPKVSACGVTAATLQLEKAPVAELLALYSDLSSDETPMVRRAAAKYIGKVLEKAGPSAIITTTPNSSSLNLQPLCRDEQDSVRLLAVGALSQVGPAFGEANTAWTAQNWLPLVKEGSTDMSW